MSDDFKLGKLEGQMQGMSEKMDSVILTMNNFTQGLGQRVELHGNKIAGIESDIENQEKHISSVSSDLKTHVEGHGKWIATVIALISLAGIIFSYLK